VFVIDAFVSLVETIGAFLLVWGLIFMCSFLIRIIKIVFNKIHKVKLKPSLENKEIMDDKLNHYERERVKNLKK